MEQQIKTERYGVVSVQKSNDEISLGFHLGKTYLRWCRTREFFGAAELFRHLTQKSQNLQSFIDIIRLEEVKEIDPPLPQPFNTSNDLVKNPKHYQIFDGVESIEVIACSLTREQWKGFCFGNVLKYRNRAGKKDKLEQDIAKANEYESLYEKYKHLNKGVE